METPSEWEGQCFCGGVAYRVAGPVKFVAHDHCSICRRISGAAFVTWAGVVAERFTLLRGADVLTRFSSSPEATREFCARCGSHLFFRSTRWPGEVHFTVASVVDARGLEPKAHVFASDACAWCATADDLPRLGGATGLEPL